MLALLRRDAAGTWWSARVMLTAAPRRAVVAAGLGHVGMANTARRTACEVPSPPPPRGSAIRMSGFFMLRRELVREHRRPALHRGSRFCSTSRSRAATSLAGSTEIPFPRSRPAALRESKLDPASR